MDLTTYPPRSLPDHHDAWTRAALRGDQADPFCCAPEWQMAFHDTFDPDSRVLVEASTDGVIAFAEHRAGPEDIFLTPLEVHWFFGSPLLGEGAVELLDRCMPEIERLYEGRCPKIVVSGIRPDTERPLQLLRTFGGRFDCYLHSTGLQCVASLSGGVDGFLSRRSANHRKKLKKQTRRAREAGVACERRVPSSPEELDVIYDRILAVECASWKGRERCGMAESPSREFYHALLHRLVPSRRARIMFARHEDRDIGYVFGGRAGDVYRGQQFSYDEAWRNHSIGNLLQLEQVTWLCEEGATRYDMGPITGPRMEYKAHWTEQNIEIQTWIMARR